MTNILKNKSSKRIVLHIIFWIFIFLIFSIIYIYPEILAEGLIKNLVYFPAVIVFTYFFLYVLNKLIILKKKFLLFMVAFSFSVSAYTLVIYGIDQTIMPVVIGKSDFLRYNLNTFFHSAWGVVMIALAAGYIKMIRTWHRTDEDKIRYQLEKSQAYNQLLRSKINPHFLFNTLNNITCLLEFDREKAKESIIGLGDLMAYMVYEADADFVPLEKEIKYIIDFIALQMLRMEKEEFVSFSLEGEPKGHRIASMLLIPFVENTFKYCDREACPGIFINIRINDGLLEFQAENAVTGKEGISKESGGFGIDNVKKRLEQLYPGMYQLFIQSEDHRYKVSLSIRLEKCTEKEKHSIEVKNI